MWKPFCALGLLAGLVRAFDLDGYVANMTLEEKVGQVLVPDFRNWQNATASGATGFTVMNDEVAGIIKKFKFGGVILFAENVVETEQTTRLMADFQAASPNIPLILCIDQEGGIVRRLATGTNFPGNMGLGATRSTSMAQGVGKVIGEELGVLGININLAPVSDVNYNPANPVIGVRSFGSDQHLVADMAVAYKNGVQEAGVASCAKHFPGHGDTNTDSHTGLPLINHTVAQHQKDLYPFRQLIANNIDMIMTAHIQIPAFSNDTAPNIIDGTPTILPATLSRKILTSLLREQLGFKGVTITDALDMAAIQEFFGWQNATWMCLAAGADIALMPPRATSMSTVSNLENAFNTVLEAVNDGRINITELDQKVKRILNLKMTYKIWQPDTQVTPISLDKQIKKALNTVGNKEHRRFEAKVADAAVTLLRNNHQTLPFKVDKRSTVAAFTPFSYQLDAVNVSMSSMRSTKYVKLIGTYFYQQNFTSAMKTLVDQATHVIIGSYIVVQDAAVNGGVLDPSLNDASHWDSVTPFKIMEYARAQSKPTVIMSLRNPYDASSYLDAGNQSADALVVLYDYLGYKSGIMQGPMIPAGLRYIFGELKQANGKLPVDVYKLGTNNTQILFPFGYSAQ
ncbi:hypothetical protein BZG36_02363 [Bifiguratus adelaidae]|uniref:beta-N-acetylhexosaminidase n=1 Tax=Bifiguratus adelaidae TaxID=1938954 RepID=A0A261Y172_9FUNG|nr:hypothetical protein BZG36_02363 [Bifiguratus adelaidae]